MIGVSERLFRTDAAILPLLAAGITGAIRSEVLAASGG